MQQQLTRRGLERRVKRYFSGDQHQFVAITTPGCEEIGRKEIGKIDGATITGVEKGLVLFTGSIDLIYHTHLILNTVNRILLRITSFTARSYPELFNKLSRSVRWEVFVGYSQTVHFTAASKNSRLHHTANIENTAFDACHSHLGNSGLTVTRSKEAPISFHIRYFEDRCTLSIDASGDLLYKRGYRTETGKAPLRETVAASLLFAAAYEKYPVIADPCCGTGAIILEALRISSEWDTDRKFAFMHWPMFSQRKWDFIKSAMKKSIPDGRMPMLIASDIDPVAIKKIESNGKKLHGFDKVEIQCADCMSFNKNGEFGTEGLLISNLPFGKRIDVSGNSLHAFYQRLGEALLKNCRGWDFGFLVESSRFEKNFPIACRTVLNIQNGGLSLRFVCGSII